MGPVPALSVLALRHAAQALPAGEAAAAAVELLVERFTDHSQRLSRALQQANDRAWRALEIALAGESFWNRLGRAEDRAFRQQVRAFLDAAPLHELDDKGPFRQQCVRELRQARKAGLLQGAEADPRALAQEVGELARFADPQSALEAEWRKLAQLADSLQGQGYRALADLLRIRPAQGPPLLVTAVRYFFRRAVEGDEQLARGLAFAQMERLQRGQEEAFAGLHLALADQGQRLEHRLAEAQQAAAATHAAVLDVRAEQQRLGEQGRDIYQEVLRLQEKLDLVRREVRPRDSLSLRSDEERRLVKQVVARYRALPEGQRQQMPALLNAIGQLEVAAGDFQSAQGDFAAVAALVPDGESRGLAHLNAYRAALEQRDWATAIRELAEAVKLDGRAFAPFPVGKYQPRRILGAGGFGVAFLCRHKELSADVVVKALHGEELERSLDEVFAEARALYQLEHPAIIRLLDCGYTLPASRSRPFVVMNYFPGRTLEEQVRQGPLAVADLLAVARLMAQGLHAAHQRGILHRDVKPANVLVHKGASGWQVKLIDFGLALRSGALQGTLRGASTQHSVVGGSIAGTIDYAAPEQLGRLPGVPVGPYSDVYGWARTCCFALFGTTQPLRKHWTSIPEPLAELLERCLEQDPQARPAGFAEVLERLDQAGAGEGGEERDYELVEEVLPADGAEDVEEVLPADGFEVVKEGRAARRPRHRGGAVGQHMHHIRLLERMRELLACHEKVALAKERGTAIAVALILGILLGLPSAVLGGQAGDSVFGSTLGIAVSVCGCGVLPTVLLAAVLLGWKYSRQMIMTASAARIARDIARQYPDVVESWGGELVLDNATNVEKLLHRLERQQEGES